MNFDRYACYYCDSTFSVRKIAIEHVYKVHSNSPKIKAAIKIKHAKQELKKIPFIFDPKITIKIYERFYQKLKKEFNHLPILDSQMFKISSKLNGHDAQTDVRTKEIWISRPVLRRNASVQDILGNNDYMIRSGTLLHLEILTHEVAHWNTIGKHNSRFYAKQKMYFNKLINKLISGELYQ